MNAERAEQIAFASNMAKVKYNGEAVYIEHVDKDHGLATVHPINNPNKKLSVPVDALQEQ